MGDPTFGVLGPLRVRARGAEVRIGGPKPRAVLATLLLQPGAFVSLDMLVEVLWPGGAPRSAVANVRTYVRALRRALSEAGVATGGLRTRPSGYAFDAAPGDIDMSLFEQRLERARAERDRGDDDAALRRYESALGLWRGSVLQDVPSSVVWDPVIARAEEARSAAVGECLEVRLRMGEYTPLVAELRSRLAEDPLREDLWQMLVRALHGSGRTAQARAAYAEAERILAAELGVEPGASLRRTGEEVNGYTGLLRKPVLKPSRCASFRWTCRTSPAGPRRSPRWRGCCRRPTVAGSRSSPSCRARRARGRRPWRSTWRTGCAAPSPTASSSWTWAG
ncbi:AfsR/SARP family transcriptional regulator [Streptomyces radiopugnans]|nr:AfsR/SARP family transcriptional regulator [Streptomyces radiopugnans]